MISIAIDGPSGSGKSTLARKLARELDFIYVDTGALYRAIAYNLISKKVENYEEENISKLLTLTQINIQYLNGNQRVILNTYEDITEKIRTPEIAMLASKISSISIVREFLLELQLNMARKNNVVMDGRDIGTVILPNAKVKIFLTASPQVRAERRYKEHIDKNEYVIFEDILSDIIKRDNNDKTRLISPLKKAKDAIIIDTSNITLKETFEKILQIIKIKIGKDLNNDIL